MENYEELPNRCTIIMDSELKDGYLANAIAVIALTAGKKYPFFVGQDLIDANNINHQGYITTGIPMLKCNQEELKSIRKKAIEKGFEIVDFPVEGQSTKDYDELIDIVSRTKEEDINYLGIAIIGKRNPISKLTKNLEMM